MSSNQPRSSLATKFSHFIDTCGHPVQFVAEAVEALAILAPLSPMFHPTHAFEMCHIALFFAHLNLVFQLHRHHRTQQD